MRYWLMKSEPDVYGIDDLKRERRGHWDGVRNYQVRNMLRDQMRKHDQAFFYHSSCKQPGIVGIMTIACDPYPDFTAWDVSSRHYDPKSTVEKPRWLMVDVAYERKFAGGVALSELKKYLELVNMQVLKRGNRLSITPVTENEWNFVLQLAQSA